MYFAILGKNPEISMAELKIVHPIDISYPKKGIIVFDTIHGDQLAGLAGCIKSGPVVQERDLPELLAEVNIIGIKETANGKHLKNTIGIRRFKLVDLYHTDKEIKTKGKELINLGNGKYGIVEHYQDISLYESIDFDKPARSMQMGMMPAKLAHLMINIGLNSLPPLLKEVASKGETEDFPKINTTIYDPFVGSGTTGMLANALGYDFIGSDIQMQYAQENFTRRRQQSRQQAAKEIQLFTHDIFQPLASEYFQDKELLIVSEGWLGPIVTKSTEAVQISRYQEEVSKLYLSFIDRLQQLAKRAKSLSTVISIPYYLGQKNFLEKKLADYARTLGLEIQSIPEVYSREGQQVGRKILIIK